MTDAREPDRTQADLDDKEMPGVPDHRRPDGPGRAPAGPEVHQTGPGQHDGSEG
jgi:hypothetical protein